MTKPVSGEKPWFAPEEKPKGGALSVDRLTASSKNLAPGVVRAFKTISYFRESLVAIACAVGSGGTFSYLILSPSPVNAAWAVAVGGIFLLGLSIFFFIRQAGRSAVTLSPMHSNEPLVRVAFKAAQGEMKIDEGRTKTLPAPELALHQFVQQVRAYATEKAYLRNKPAGDRAGTVGAVVRPEQADLLKRRWDEVLDSLAEFELYLANDPQAIIEKLTTKYPTQLMDVSQIFREVGEGFDNTWRRKGINIESAIVTPLRATTNEAVLRRLLVGPWRASAYFARRGNGVVFSAKSVNNKVVARWECEGLVIHDEYLKFAQDTEIPLNERIERGMQMIATDAASPNTLNALISLLTWIDLAKACAVDFAFKHTNEGFVIELNLK